MSQIFKTKRRVEFRDTDAAGIVHFSVFFNYMEQAEHEMLRAVGLGVMLETGGQHIGFPRVHAECNYRSPIKFEQVVEIEIEVQRIGDKSITYGFMFQGEGRLVADGVIAAACCELSGGRPVSTPVPMAFVEALKPYCVDPPA